MRSCRRSSPKIPPTRPEVTARRCRRICPRPCRRLMTRQRLGSEPGGYGTISRRSSPICGLASVCVPVAGSRSRSLRLRVRVPPSAVGLRPLFKAAAAGYGVLRSGRAVLLPAARWEKKSSPSFPPPPDPLHPFHPLCAPRYKVSQLGEEGIWRLSAPFGLPPPFHSDGNFFHAEKNANFFFPVLLLPSLWALSRRGAYLQREKHARGAFFSHGMCPPASRLYHVRTTQSRVK